MVYKTTGFFFSNVQFSDTEVVNGMILNRNAAFVKSIIKREVLSASLVICKQVVLL